MIYIRLVVVFLEKFPDYSNVINTPLQNADLRRCFRILDRGHLLGSTLKKILTDIG